MMRYVVAVLALLAALFCLYRFTSLRSSVARIEQAPQLSARTANTNSGTVMVVEGKATGGAGLLASTTYVRATPSGKWQKLSSDCPALNMTVDGVGPVAVTGGYELVTDRPFGGYSRYVTLTTQKGVANGDRIAAYGILNLDSVKQTRTLQCQMLTPGSMENLVSERRTDSWFALGEAVIALLAVIVALVARVPNLAGSPTGWIENIVRTFLN